MRSSRVVKASDNQCRSRNCPGFDHSILRHCGIWGAAADEAGIINIKRSFCAWNFFFFWKELCFFLLDQYLASLFIIFILCFSWMIGPTEPQDFYTNYWEKKPLHIKRGDPNYYKDVFSCKGGQFLLLSIFLMFKFSLVLSCTLPYCMHRARRSRLPENFLISKSKSCGSGSRRAKMTHKSRNLFKSSCFEVLDSLFWDLKASSVTWTFFMEA